MLPVLSHPWRVQVNNDILDEEYTITRIIEECWTSFIHKYLKCGMWWVLQHRRRLLFSLFLVVDENSCAEYDTHPLKNAVARLQRMLHCRYIKAYLKHKWNYLLVDNVTEAPVGFSSLQSLLLFAAAEAIIKAQHFLRRHFLIGQPTTLVGKVVGQICTLNVSACLRQQKTHRQELRIIIFGKEFKPTYPYHPFLWRVTLSLHGCRRPTYNSSPDNSWGATKRKECFFNDGQVDTLILKHVLGNGHTCITDTVYTTTAEGAFPLVTET